MSEYITPGVIITLLILLAISSWLFIGRIWPHKIVDNIVRRDQLFRYLNALGVVLSAKGSNKTNSLYYKAYMGFLVTTKLKTADKLAEYNKNVIDKLAKLNPKEINEATLDLLNCIRKEYKIDKSIMKIWISDLNYKPAQQVDAPEPATMVSPALQTSHRPAR
ncbi:hypothetical protein LBMAG53_21980 [Planctomycetota bacterium]|nr:hypothetical protein LBMAG53_21980 [Planctomycetota bacterium]